MTQSTSSPESRGTKGVAVAPGHPSALRRSPGVRGLYAILPLLASLCGVQLSTSVLEAQWTSIAIDRSNGSPYRCWRRPDGTPVDEVLYMDHLITDPQHPNDFTPWLFCNQTVANNHLQVDSAGNTWLLGGGGIVISSETPIYPANPVGDSITLLKRNPDGTYDTNPAPDDFTHAPMVLHFPPIRKDDPLCPASGTCDWGFKGGLGAGSGLAQTIVPTTAGSRFFAIVGVSFYNGYQYGQPYSADNRRYDKGCAAAANTPNGSKGWVTWAVSKYGYDWSFVAQAGGLTNDPALSIRLVARSDEQLAWLYQPQDDPCTYRWANRYIHMALFYNKYDNYFYPLLGWWSEAGLRTTWWRMLFNPGDTYGLGPVQRLTNGAVPPNYSPTFVPVTGCTHPQDGTIRACIPLSPGWEADAQYPNTLQPGIDDLLIPVEPMDLVQLQSCTQNCASPLYNTTFDSTVLFYLKTEGYGTCPTTVTFVKGVSPVFPFFDSAPNPQALDVAFLTQDMANSTCYSPIPPATVKYTPMGGTGGFYTSVRQNGQQSDGAPKVTGYLAARRIDLHPQPDACTGAGNFCDGLHGLLPANFVLSGSGVYPYLSSISPRSGPAAGGTTVTITGVGFQAGASVRIAGVPATNVVVTATQITARTPAIGAGTLGDVLVTNVPSQQAGRLPEGFLTDFGDVPSSHAYHNVIAKLTRDHISKGCGGGNFCPTTAVTRDQMSLFLLKSKYSSFAYFPIPAVGVFADVPPANQFAPWIEELYREGVTTGCGGGNFCPSTAVTRDTMAKFLLTTKFGATYTPPQCSTATFSDVPCNAPFANWIYDAANKGFMTGCGGGKFCPASTVLRQEMAQDLAATFGLP